MAALFIATMAFLLALFVYFKNCSTRNLLEPLVPGFEEKMKSNWVVTGRGGAEDDIVMAFRGDIKFEFKPDGYIHCKGVKLMEKCECNELKAETSMKTNGLAECKTLIGHLGGKIANWRVKHDRLGVIGKADLEMGRDNWCRLLNFDKGGFAGSPGQGGFAGFNLWSDIAKNGKCFCGGFGGPYSNTPVVPHKHALKDVPHSGHNMGGWPI